MHPLHDYIAKQLAERLKSKKLVVWYDARGEFALNLRMPSCPTPLGSVRCRGGRSLRFHGERRGRGRAPRRPSSAGS